MVFGLAHWSALVASPLPIVCAGIAKFGSFGRRCGEGGYDNSDPRGWLARMGAVAVAPRRGVFP